MPAFVEVGGGEGHFLRFDQTERDSAVMSFAAPLGFSGAATVALEMSRFVDALSSILPALNSTTVSLAVDGDLDVGIAIDSLGHVVVSVHYREWARLGELETRFAFSTDQSYLAIALDQARRWDEDSQ